jgi:hypothetical protein
MQKIQAIMQNPQLASAYLQQDPRLQKAFDVLSSETNPNDFADMEKMFANQNFSGEDPQETKKSPEKERK